MINKLKFLKIGSSLLMLLFFAACSQDETLRQDALLPEGKFPLVLTAGGLDVVATPDKVNTRATSDNNWNKTNEKVALQVEGDNNVYLYKVGQGGTLTSENPYYWTSTIPIYVKAWVFGDNEFREKLTEWEVRENQNIDDLGSDNYQNSDFIYAPAKEVSFYTNTELTFHHQTAKIIVHVYNKEIAAGKDDNAITMTVGTDENPIVLGGEIQEPSQGSNFVNWKITDKEPKGVVTAKKIGSVPFNESVNSAASFYALVIPQTIAGEKKLFKFTVPGLENIPFYYTTPKDGVEWKAGTEYTYLITIKGTSDEVTVNSITHGKWGDGGTYNLTTN